MAKSCLNTSSHPFTPASNEDFDRLSNSELISFLESSFRRSEFITVARILKSREELAKAEASKYLSKLSHLEAKNSILEEELHGLRSNEAVGKLERELVKKKSSYFLLRASYENMEKLHQEKIEVLMEEIRKEQANCLRLEEKMVLEKTINERIAEVDLWKSKYSLLEAWILRFLEDNPPLIGEVREQVMNGKNQDVEFFRINKAAGELLRRNPASYRKESLLAARTNAGGKNSNKRKFQIAQTSGDRRVLELDVDDDVVCISDLKVNGLK